MPLAFTIYPPRRRIEWHAIKDMIPIADVAERLLGPPAKGEGGKLLWCCPFHEDRNPSFEVDPQRGRWKCWSGCGSGDAADLVERLEGIAFPEAAKRLADMFHLDVGHQTRPPAASSWSAPKRPAKPPPKPSGLPADVADKIVVEAVERLWSPEGAESLAYLMNERFLTEETIRRHRLGCVHNLVVPKSDGSGTFTVTGIAIPWFETGLLVKVNVRLNPPMRLRGGKLLRYISVFGDNPGLYAPAEVRPGLPLVVVEGELEALLLSQELGDHADVVTLGGATSKPTVEALALAEGRELYLAHDADPAGDRAAALWPSRGIRVRPPEKDWTEVRAGGFGRIAYIWGRYLPLGSPPRAEDFADITGMEPDERGRIEAMEEREAIQNEPRLSTAELAAHLREIGHHEKAEALAATEEPETDIEFVPDLEQEAEYLLTYGRD